MKRLEKWMPVHNFSNYKISSFGVTINVKTGKVIKPIKSNGYLLIKFYRDGKRSTRHLHRVLAIHFIPNPDNKPFINHKDGNRSNNCLENLEWCTQKENVIHYHTVLKPKRIGNKSLLFQICNYAFPIKTKPYDKGIIDKRFRLAKMIREYAAALS